MEPFVMLLGGAAFALAALLLIAIGSRELPRVATVCALAGLGLGYLIGGPWCAAFGAFVGLFLTGWMGTIVFARRKRAALAAKGREPTWNARYLAAIQAGDVSAAERLLLQRPAR